MVRMRSEMAKKSLRLLLVIKIKNTFHDDSSYSLNVTREREKILLF